MDTLLDIPAAATFILAQATTVIAFPPNSKAAGPGRPAECIAPMFPGWSSADQP